MTKHAGIVRWLVILLAVCGALPAAVVTRGPYLQTATQNSAIVRWRTDEVRDSRVRYGDAPGNLTLSADGTTTGTTEHVVQITGLSPASTYFYTVGTTTETLTLAGPDYHFRTLPTSTHRGPTRVWILGDSGTANANARAVRDAYATFTGTRETDVWLMLGDNAYNTGTDANYQAAVFDTYPSFLRNTVLWPTLGNHDAASADSPTQSGVYYDIFSLPKLGEAGGVPSGTEAYYSFDYGHIHFICLDSHDTPRTVAGTMLTWLDADLASNTKEWVIAFWHHPPYTKGSHDSDVVADSSGRMRDMRENALPILEGRGIDMVLTGHSHSYERSFLLDGHYGDSTTFTPAMKKNAGDGRPAGDGAYGKATAGMGPNEGTVYVVAGSSGQISGGTLDHPAMYISLNTLGSLVLDVDDHRLDASFISGTGTVDDTFTIIKGMSGVSPEMMNAVTSPKDHGKNHVPPGDGG
jgi:hypothetical protein